ncbi:MAG: GNAT family N-acetyltransferase [Coriobacteriales bacterium]|nr:GNAT family N-acetyltransferase [Coriobacteriales bacterium]
MEALLREILDWLRTGDFVGADEKRLAQLILRHNRGRGDNRHHFAKKRILPFYFKVKETEPERWAAWHVDPELERRLVRLLRVKPRRTASGVATLTVLTKPWPCANDCLYCPSDLRMPKSYLSDEPACQRAERNYFDPYLQVVSRLRALTQMGHATDKVELIILGGSWSDYPEHYQLWFVSELFRALNDGDAAEEAARTRRQQYRERGCSNQPDALAAHVAPWQQRVDAGELSYNQALARLYHEDGGWRGGAESGDDAERSNSAGRGGGSERGDSGDGGGRGGKGERNGDAGAQKRTQKSTSLLCSNQAVAQLYHEDGGEQNGDAGTQKSTSLLCSTADDAPATNLNELYRQHRINETARHRVVGLVVETRPDAVNVASLEMLRRLGCTKVQIGVQSLDPAVLKANNRRDKTASVRRAFALLRIFGFKIHAHFMVNLYGSTPEQDRRDFQCFVSEKAYLPDELKLYPCALVAGTRLCEHYADGSWRPYSEAELVQVLVADTLNTPRFMRISRMIRDISAHDIVAGNRKANLRQLVEAQAAEVPGMQAQAADRTQLAQEPAASNRIAEIRYREISTSETDLERLQLNVLHYQTSVSGEYFLEWTTPEDRIVAFLRLSLPQSDYLRKHQAELPVRPGEAMIREVHVYGTVAELHGGGENAQHRGLGRQLIEKACAIAREQGYQKLNVISSVGTREYYRSLGFADGGLYQQKLLN